MAYTHTFKLVTNGKAMFKSTELNTGGYITSINPRIMELAGGNVLRFKDGELSFDIDVTADTIIFKDATDTTTATYGPGNTTITAAALNIALNPLFPKGTDSTTAALTMQQWQLEGMGYSMQGNSNTVDTAVAAGATLATFTFNVPFGKSVWIESITFSASDSTTRVYFFANLTTSGSNVAQSHAHLFGISGGQNTISVNQLLHEGGSVIVSVAALIAGNRPAVMASASGIQVTPYFNNAAKVISCWGDSIQTNSIGADQNPTSDFLYPYALTNALLDSGKSVRLVDKAITGKTTTDLASRVLELSGVPYDLLLVGYGMNDSAGSAVSTANYKLNLFKAIYNRNRYRPKASIIFIAPNLTDVSTRSTIAAYRTAMQEVATDATYGGTSNKVYYYDSSTAFALNATASADTNFISTERIAGSRTHPSGTGHNFILYGPTGLAADNAGLWGLVKTTNFYSGL